ncbi:AMP phosphorylase [Candidatus Woesearchaeota archaeon]|nr:AMP phosphorylase [Candidatus Woesearchaeota archaeon]
MKFKAKILNIATKGPLIAILNKIDVQTLSLIALDRIRIKKKDKSKVVAIDIAYGKKEVMPGEIGLFLDIADELGIKERDEIEIFLEAKPESLQYIKKKLDKKELNKYEIDKIIKDLLANKLTEVEVTYFTAACYINKMTLEESAYLAEAIVNNGGKLKFNKKIIVGKHCIGGLSGNRTTPIVVSIVAAAGITIPKTSTRSITSPAGTADCFEVLAPVSHSKEKIIDIVKKTNGCMVWGGTLDLASADDKLIQLEKPLSLDPEGFLLASILAKKSAEDCTHVLIDIPIGPEAKIKEKKEAKNLSEKFIKLGKKLNIKIKTIITDGSQPIGNGIGPALEAKDVLLIIKNKNCPKDLKKKSLYMAGIIFEMVGYKNGNKKALEILESGKAYKKLQEIIKEQGGNPNIQPEDIKIGEYKYTFKSHKNGKIKHISNALVTRIAKSAGAPNDKGAGVYLHKKVGDKVNTNEQLFTIYAESKDKLTFSMKENLNEVMKID